MKKVFGIILSVAVLLSCGAILLGCDTDKEKQDDNYPVAGIWHAGYVWHEDNPYNYGGDTYRIDIWMEFRDDSTMKIKQMMKLNGHIMNDNSDWIILNMTWTVNKNIITLSSGKQYVIIDDTFNDTYPGLGTVLHCTKETQ